MILLVLHASITFHLTGMANTSEPVDVTGNGTIKKDGEEESSYRRAGAMHQGQSMLLRREHSDAPRQPQGNKGSTQGDWVVSRWVLVITRHHMEWGTIPSSTYGTRKSKVIGMQPANDCLMAGNSEGITCIAPLLAQGPTHTRRRRKHAGFPEGF